jgi:hypothetical protein
MKRSIRLFVALVLFSIHGSSVLAAPQNTATLLSPSGTLTEWDGSFHWTGVDGATFYLMELKQGGVQLFARWYDAETHCSGTSCSLTPDETSGILMNDDYQWRLVDYGAYGYGEYTEYMNFTIAIDYGAPILGDPIGTLSNWDGSFHWTGFAEATFYRMEVLDGEGSLLLGQWYSAETYCSGTSCSVAPPELSSLPNGDYQWRLVDYGQYGNGNYTEYQPFTVTTAIETPTPTPTATNTPTATATNTATSTPTDTPTITFTPTVTNTPYGVPTWYIENKITYGEYALNTALLGLLLTTILVGTLILVMLLVSGRKRSRS